MLSIRPLFLKIRFEVELRELLMAAKEHSELGLATRSREVLASSFPHEGIYFFSYWFHWSQDVYFEYGMCIHARGVINGWQNVELFSVSPLMWSNLYTACLLWSESVEYCRALTIPAPTDLQIYELSRRQTSWRCSCMAHPCHWIWYYGAGAIPSLCLTSHRQIPILRPLDGSVWLWCLISSCLLLGWIGDMLVE